MGVQYDNMHRMQDPVLQNLMGFLADVEEFVFLDTSRPDHENSQSLLFLEPTERIICKVGDDLQNYLNVLQERLNAGFYLAGWVAYEFGAWLEDCVNGPHSKRRPIQNFILADFGVFKKPYKFNHVTGENDFPIVGGQINDSRCKIENLRANMDKKSFVQALHRVREYITAGDTYQVNYTMKLLFDFKGSAELLYLLLRKNQSVAYGAYIRNGNERTLSFSPEMFFRKSGDEITVRPMKGTAPRGRMAQEEKSNSLELHHDIKNRSENVMIVDLLRNDLAHLMHGHGQSEVFVESLFDVESYESLLQMTSTIKAKSSDFTMCNLNLTEIFRSLFPSGSITGAPKIRTMQVIDELEIDYRGVYTGAIGYFGPEGSAIFSVPIRTIRLQEDKGEMGIGAGITYGSVPEEEWEESLLKGKFLTHSQPDFQLFETLLWRPESGYWLLDEHLERLRQASKYFNFSFDKDHLCSLLKDVQVSMGKGCYRVRLSLEKDGRAETLKVACEPPELTGFPSDALKVVTAGLPEIAFSDHQVDPNSPWRFHKTTLRDLYDKEYQRARQEQLFDYVFCNNAGEVTEGCITNLFIYQKGLYLTSPVSCGLLPGVIRRHLIETGGDLVQEKPLNKEDVINADAIFLCNSVRGVVRVQLRKDAI